MSFSPKILWISSYIVPWKTNIDRRVFHYIKCNACQFYFYIFYSFLFVSKLLIVNDLSTRHISVIFHSVYFMLMNFVTYINEWGVSPVYNDEFYWTTWITKKVWWPVNKAVTGYQIISVSNSNLFNAIIYK